VIAMGILLGLLCLLLSAFFSGSETGLYTVNRFRLHRRAGRGERSARLLERLLSDPVGLLVTFLVGNNIVNYCLAALVTRGFEGAGFETAHGWWRSPDVLATLTLVLPLFLFGEMLPKNYFRRHTERLSYFAAWGLAAAKALLFPMVWLLRLPARMIPSEHGAGASLGMPQISRHMLDRLLTHGRETGELTAEQERLARNVLRAGERRVVHLARPVGATAALPAAGSSPSSSAPVLTVPADERAGRVLQRLIDARTRLAVVMTPVPSSQLPVASGTQKPGGEPLTTDNRQLTTPVVCRDVLGYVRLFDLLAPGAQGRPVSELVRPVPRLTAHTTLRGALNVMQRECADLAIVESPPARPARGAKRDGAVKTDTGFFRLGPGDILPEPGTGHGEPACPLLGVVRLPELISELLSKPPDGQPAPGGARVG